jgi:META domain
VRRLGDLLIVAALVLGLAACAPAVDLRGTVWTVVRVEGADPEASGQIIEFTDASTLRLTAPCGTYVAPVTLDSRIGSIAFGRLEQVQEHSCRPTRVAMLQAPLLEALPLVSGWRVRSVDTVELTGGPTIRLDRTPGRHAHRISVDVVSSRDGWPTPPLVLAIGDRTWAIEPGSGGGEARVQTNEPVTVLILRPIDCRLLYHFLAPLDTNWQVRFTSESAATLIDVSAGSLAAGPTLAEIAPQTCL